MENRFSLETKTGDIVTQFPKASSIFKEYKIDFCCGGNRPIGEALEDKALDKEAILDEINELYVSTNQDSQVDWTRKSYSEIVDYVTQVHHGYLKQVLPELSAYVTKVHHVHGGNHPELTTIYTVFHQLKNEIEIHLYKEEKSLFPKIKEYEQVGSELKGEEVIDLINQLETEHDYSGKLLKTMREVTEDYRIPDGACNTFQLTYLKLEELESDMFQHIHLENNILFPRIMNESAS